MLESNSRLEWVWFQTEKEEEIPVMGQVQSFV